MTDDLSGVGIRAQTLMRRCDDLARCTEVEGEVTRPYGTDALWRARDVLTGWMQDAGLETRTDTVGNLYGRWMSENAERLLLIGGHFDSVVDAGKYDGILGVLTGIATVEHLRESGAILPFGIEVVAIADEEGNRFRTGLMGSAAASGIFREEWLDLEDSSGQTLRDLFAARGVDPSGIVNDALPASDYIGFIETHIEQGPVLEGENLPVGIVSVITGSQRATVTFTGMAGHAGTVPMSLRQDALVGAAEFVLAVEEIGRETPEMVATVGKLEVSPGAPNVIPGAVTLSLDVRHERADLIAGAVRFLHERAGAIAQARGLTLDWDESLVGGSTICDPELVVALGDAIDAEGIARRELFSGAGHDAISFAQIMPVSMLFVRCEGGISHNPAESITVDDVEIALRVLQRFVRQLGHTR